MILLDGKKTSQEIKSEIAEKVKQIKEAGGKPHIWQLFW
jgi:5,10-methylene-tetrahydrofolate dehydrogenase/methenyl tetrahydrofolate cyclohydrolase